MNSRNLSLKYKQCVCCSMASCNSWSSVSYSREFLMHGGQRDHPGWRQSLPPLPFMPQAGRIQRTQAIHKLTLPTEQTTGLWTVPESPVRRAGWAQGQVSPDALSAQSSTPNPTYSQVLKVAWGLTPGDSQSPFGGGLQSLVFSTCNLCKAGFFH